MGNKIPNTASIVGRGIVVHQLVDSGAGCVLGNSGSRYAIGTIGIADETLSIPNPPISINTNFVDQSCEIDYSTDYTTIDTTRNVNDDDDDSSSSNNSSFNFEDDDSSSSDASIISSSIVALVTAFIAFF